MIKKFTYSLFVTLAFSFALSSASPAATQQSSAKSSETHILDLNARENFSWTTAPWTGDERPYSAARAAVDSAALRPGFDDYVNGCAVAAQQRPSDAILAFTWAYAVWVAGLQKKSGGALDRMVEAIWWVPDRDDIINTYDGARIRFLYDACDTLRSNSGLIPLGIRLLNHNKHDFSVQLGLAALYVNEAGRVKDGGRDLINKSMALFRQAEVLQPNNPMPYGGISDDYVIKSTYWDGWNWKVHAKLTALSQQDLEAAIPPLKQDISLTNPRDPWHDFQIRLLNSYYSVLKESGSN
jgi:hypothetical protein